MHAALLCDGIVLPIAAAAGFCVFAPLIALVTVVEALTLKRVLGARFRSLFWMVFLANAASTFAGVFVAAFHDVILNAVDVRRSIPFFLENYIWVSVLLSVLYFLKSTAVESLVLFGWMKRLTERRGKTILLAITLANVVGYCFMGPLFYWATKPNYGGVEATYDTRWTKNPETVVFFLDSDTQHLNRINADGSNLQSVVQRSIRDYLASGDGRAIVFVDHEYRLCVQRGDDAPTELATVGRDWTTNMASISHDGTRVVYIEGRDARVYDVDKSRELARFATPTYAVCWSRDGADLYFWDGANGVSVVHNEPPYEVTEERRVQSFTANDYAPNYTRCDWSNCETRGSREWTCEQHDEKPPYAVETWPHLGVGLSIRRDGERFKHIMDDHGLMKMGLPTPTEAAFLANGYEVILHWRNELYIVDIEANRLGLLTRGERYVATSPSFAVWFADPEKWRKRYQRRLP